MNLYQICYVDAMLMRKARITDDWCLVAEPNPPIDDVVQMGIVPRFVELLQHSTNSVLQALRSSHFFFSSLIM